MDIITITAIASAIAAIVKAVRAVRGLKAESQRAEVAEHVLEAVSEGLNVATQKSGKLMIAGLETDGQVARTILDDFVKPALTQSDPVRSGIALIDEANTLFRKFGTKANAS